MSNYKFRQAAKMRKFTAFFIASLLLATLAAVLIYQDGTNVFDLIANFFVEEPPARNPSVNYP